MFLTHRVFLLILFLISSITIFAKSPAAWTKRGTYKFNGDTHCPLEGLLKLPPGTCNRIALDDDNSVVTFNAGENKITWKNTAAYSEKQMIGDVVLVGTAENKDSGSEYIGVHLVISKKKQGISTDLHYHTPIPGKPVSYKFPKLVFEIISDGQTVTIGENEIAKALSSGQFMRSRVKFRQQESKVANTYEYTMGFGVKFIEKKLLSAQFVDGNATMNLVDLFTKGTWEINLTALSSLLPKNDFQRDFFLYGLDKFAILDEVKKSGLSKGTTLTLGARQGKGYVKYKGQEAEFPDIQSKIRDFLEFNSLGMSMLHHAKKARKN